MAKKATAEQASAQKEAQLLEAARGRSVCPGRRQELWRRDGANRRWLRIGTKEMGRPWGHPSSETSAFWWRAAAHRPSHRTQWRSTEVAAAHLPHLPPSAHRATTKAAAAAAAAAHRAATAAAHRAAAAAAHRAAAKAAHRAAAKAAHRAATKAAHRAAAKPTHRCVARWLRRAALVASAA